MAVSVTAPTGNVAFAGNPLVTPANGTGANGAVSMTYYVGSHPPASVSFDPSTGSWNVPNLTTFDCPTVNTDYTITVTAYYPPPTAASIGQSNFTRTA